jgi:hypothetical protein
VVGRGTHEELSLSSAAYRAVHDGLTRPDLVDEDALAEAPAAAR